MASIPGLENDSIINNDLSKVETTLIVTDAPSTDTVDQPQLPENVSDEKQPTVPVETTIPTATSGVKASEDVRYKKYFKMLQFGVPPPAVKLKMVADGLDAQFLE